jgi:hypothetical protein
VLFDTGNHAMVRVQKGQGKEILGIILLIRDSVSGAV